MLTQDTLILGETCGKDDEPVQRVMKIRCLTTMGHPGTHAPLPIPALSFLSNLHVIIVVSITFCELVGAKIDDVKSLVSQMVTQHNRNVSMESRRNVV